MSLWNITLVILLVGTSAICSGLNIALMSLKTADLRRKKILGDARAATVLPLRENAHLSLAAILLSNVAVISATSLVLGDHFNGLVAGIMSTLLIVIFGEIIPQALFASRALTFCARFAPLLRLMIVVTYPLSKSMQLMLDAVLGKEVATLQSRHELGLIIGEHAGNDESELDENELSIMRGALSLSEKRVRDIMTPLRAAYWVTPETIVNAAKIDEIKVRGFSRIPVFNEHLTHVYGVLLMKELVDINFDERQYAVEDLHLHHTEMIGRMTALDTLFHMFITARSHLMPVEKSGRIVGIVTIEDLVEEIIGHEIEDEADYIRGQVQRT